MKVNKLTPNGFVKVGADSSLISVATVSVDSARASHIADSLKGLDTTQILHLRDSTKYETPTHSTATYVPYTGANANVDLGTRSLSTPLLQNPNNPLVFRAGSLSTDSHGFIFERSNGSVIYTICSDTVSGGWGKIRGRWGITPSYHTRRVGIDDNLWVESEIWGDHALYLTSRTAETHTTLKASVVYGDTIFTLNSMTNAQAGNAVVIGTAGLDAEIMHIDSVSNDTVFSADAFRNAHALGDSAITNRFASIISPIHDWTNLRIGGVLNIGGDQTATEAAIDSPTVKIGKHAKFQIRDDYTGTLRASNGVVSATPSDTVGLSSALAGKWAKGDTATVLATHTDTLTLHNEIAAISAINTATAPLKVAANNISIEDSVILPYSSTKASLVLTANDKNKNASTTPQAEDTSASSFTFTPNTGKPLFEMRDQLGRSVAKIDSSGFATIGDSTASNPRAAQASLTVNLMNTPNNNEVILMSRGGNTNAVRGYTWGGTYASPTALAAAKIPLSLSAGGVDSATTLTSHVGIGANIDFATGAAWTSTSHPMLMDFRVNQTGTTSRTTVMRIDTSLNVGIGTTSPTSKLHVSGTSNFTGNSLHQSNVTVGGSTIDSTLTVTGSGSISTNARVGGNLTTGGNLVVRSTAISSTSADVWHDSASGGNVLRLLTNKTTSMGSPVELGFRQAAVKTTDATPTRIDSLVTTGFDNYAFNIEAKFLGGDSSATANTAGMGRIATFARDPGGTVRQIDTTFVSYNHRGTSTMNATIAVSGNNIVLKVTGITGKTIYWHVTYQLQLMLRFSPPPP